MNLQEIMASFTYLSPHKKITFIYNELKKFPLENRVAFLLTVIKDQDSTPTVLAAALKFLQKSGYQETALFTRFLKNPYLEVSQAAHRALKEIILLGKKERDTAQEKLPKKKHSYQKSRELKTLREISKINDSWVPKTLLDSLEDATEEIRRFVISELSQRQDVNLNTLHQRLIESPWHIKCAVLEILAHKKSLNSIRYIEGVAEDPNSEVRRISAHALGEIGGEKASELLVRLTKDRNPRVQKAAVEALERASTLRFI